MKTFHPLSFILGLGTGLFLLMGLFVSTRLLTNSTTSPGTPSNEVWQQQRMGGAGNRAAMAERFGMTEEELAEALESGKTVQEIAAERGVQMPAGRMTGTGGVRARMGSGSLAASGSVASVQGISSSSVPR